MSGVHITMSEEDEGVSCDQKLRAEALPFPQYLSSTIKALCSALKEFDIIPIRNDIITRRLKSSRSTVAPNALHPLDRSANYALLVEEGDLASRASRPRERKLNKNILEKIETCKTFTARTWCAKMHAKLRREIRDMVYLNVFGETMEGGTKVLLPCSCKKCYHGPNIVIHTIM
jgi:hypothetical protein